MGWGESQGPEDGGRRIPPLPPKPSGGGIVPGVHQDVYAVSWDGQAPQVGATLVYGDLFRVVSVVQGPGLGHYVLGLEPTDRIDPDTQVVRWVD